MKTAVSLFTGCGGSDAGLVDAGFSVLMANDKLPYAKDVYLANHPETDYVLGDVADLRSFPSADLLVGCYPCQGFSQGGVRDPSRKINTLYLEFARVLRILKPKAFVVENVSGMTRSNFLHLLGHQLRVFRSAGYSVTAKTLVASDYGVAQDRKRVFIVGVRGSLDVKYNFPEPTHGDGKTRKGTLNDVIGHLPKWPKGEFYDQDFHWYYMSRNRYSGWNEQSRTIVANPRHMPLHPCSPKMVKHGHNDWRFESDKPARRFSYRESAAIQGFEDLIFPDTKGASMNMRYTVAGNAVPPPLFKAVVEAIPDIW